MEQTPVSLNEIYKILIELKAKMQKMDQYIDDLEFARRTEEAWQEIDKGEYTSYNSPEEFLETLKEKNAKDTRGK